MRVLWWTCDFWPVIGGLEVLGAEAIVRLKARGYELAVVAQGEGGVLPAEDSYAGIPIYRFPFHSALDQADLAKIAAIRRRLERLADEFQPELVHMHILGPQALFYPMVFGSRANRLLVTRHELFNPAHDVDADTIPARILRSADWVGCCSDAVLEETRRRVPEITDRSSTVMNASPMPGFEPGPISFEPPTILCVGRLDHQKGFDIALRGFAQLLTREPSARMVVAGDGALRSELESLTQELGIAHAVSFRGWVAPSDVPREMNDSTMVVVPSRYGEAFGLVALEAAQMGRPVIASRVGGLPEVVRDGVTGILVEPENSLALAEAMHGLIADPSLAVRLGATALEHAEGFAIERYTEEYDLLYQQLIDGRRDVSST